jgi:hypothetical protein
MSDVAFLHNASLDTPIVLIGREGNDGINRVRARCSLSARLLRYSCSRGHRRNRARDRWWASQRLRVADLWCISLYDCYAKNNDKSDAEIMRILE